MWYKDAVIYELHVKSYYDSNADGIGDLRGLTEKLDNLDKRVILLEVMQHRQMPFNKIPHSRNQIGLVRPAGPEFTVYRSAYYRDKRQY